MAEPCCSWCRRWPAGDGEGWQVEVHLFPGRVSVLVLCPDCQLRLGRKGK